MRKYWSAIVQLLLSGSVLLTCKNEGNIKDELDITLFGYSLEYQMSYEYFRNNLPNVYPIWSIGCGFIIENHSGTALAINFDDDREKNTFLIKTLSENVELSPESNTLRVPSADVDTLGVSLPVHSDKTVKKALQSTSVYDIYRALSRIQYSFKSDFYKDWVLIESSNPYVNFILADTSITCYNNECGGFIHPNELRRD